MLGGGLSPLSLFLSPAPFRSSLEMALERKKKSKTDIMSFIFLFQQIANRSRTLIPKRREKLYLTDYGTNNS